MCFDCEKFQYILPISFYFLVQLKSYNSNFKLVRFKCETHIIEGRAVLEHEQDVVDELLGGEVVQRVALVQFPADHRQVHGLLDDLVVVSGLWSAERYCRVGRGLVLLCVSLK